MDTVPVQLVAGRDRSADIDAFAQLYGGRVGLAGVLGNLNRVAPPAFFTRSAASWGFRLDDEDNASKRWWPQGITSSADAGQGSGSSSGSDPDLYAGRRLLVTTSYSKTVDGVGKGCRITVFDITDEQPVRYRHVLLAAVGRDDAGEPELRPVHAHAGGVVWSGSWLHVAATSKGVHTFCVDDIIRVSKQTGLGHTYVLPLRSSHGTRTAEGTGAMRYSFLSLGRAGTTNRMLAGEYGHGRMSRRLLTYDLDPSGRLADDDAGVALPRLVSAAGPSRMQGAVDVGGRLHIVTSNGRRGRGSLWVGPPDALRREARVLPPGPEDLTYWPAREELWTPTEYPGRRFVLALDRKRFD